MRPGARILLCLVFGGGCSADNPLYGLQASATSGGSTSRGASETGGQAGVDGGTNGGDGPAEGGSTHTGSNDTGPGDTGVNDTASRDSGVVDTGPSETTGKPPPEQQCCEPNGAAGCAENGDIEACVCDVYPDCCNNWTESCVALAASCGGNCILDCCIPSPQGGCDDDVVEQCVCNQDAGCCDEWDATCVAIAHASCNGSCVSDGSCCLVHNNSGCNELDVQSCVCADDPYCCTTSWDAICVTFTLDCDGCDEPGKEACCEVHDSPGCTDSLGGPAVQNCVCADAADCCSGAWVEQCAVLAVECADQYGIAC